METGQCWVVKELKKEKKKSICNIIDPVETSFSLLPDYFFYLPFKYYLEFGIYHFPGCFETFIVHNYLNQS